MHKKAYQQRPYYPGGPKNYPQAHNPYFNPENSSNIYQYSIQNRADVVGYPGGGGGAGRVPINITPQYTSVAASHPPPNSAAQVQQASQNQQIRAQVPPLSSAHNPHNSASAPPPSVSHSQHLAHPHSALAQHQHHSVLSSGNVSGAAGLANPVAQTAVAVNQGQSPAPPGSQHDLNAQSIQQAASQQLQQGTGVSLTGSVSAAHSMMYANSNPNQIPQNPQSNPPVRNLINTQQFFHHGQPNPTHMHPGNQQHRQVMTHTQPNMPAYPYTNLIQQTLVHQPNALYSPFAAAATMAQHRPATNNQHQFATQMAPPTANHYHQMTAYPVQGYQQYAVEGNPKSWSVKPSYGGAATMYFHPASKASIAPVPPLPQREKKILEIIDPSTNKNILDDMNNTSTQGSSPSPMPSTESSTTNTPAPSESVPSTKAASNVDASAIASQFALQVLLQNDKSNSVSNTQPESVECGLSTNESLEASHCVLNSEISEKDDSIINSLDSQNEPINEINQNKIVPENSVSKPEQPVSVTIQSPPPSLLPQYSQMEILSVVAPPITTTNVPQIQAQTQPPPQPQRPAKQPRGQQQQQNTHPSHGNHAKGSNQQQNSNKTQQSPPQHGNKNQSKGGAAHAVQKGNQGQQQQQQQQQSSKGRSSPNAQQSQKNANQNAQQQQQQNKHNLPQTQQPKLPTDNSQQASKIQQPQHAPLLQPISQSSIVPQQQPQVNQQPQQVQLIKEQSVPHQQGPVQQVQTSAQLQQKVPHGQVYRGASPPQQMPLSSQGPTGRRMSGEQAPAASSAGPLKPDKDASSPVENVESTATETVKETIAKPALVKRSVSPVAALAKKEATPEPSPSTGTGKRSSKDKIEETLQTKDGKDQPKAQVDEPAQSKAQDSSPANQTKQLSQGKPPKPQPANDKGAAETPVTDPPMQPTSQSPKSEIPSPQVPIVKPAPDQIPQTVAAAEVPAAASDAVDTSSNSSQPLHTEPDEAQENHVDEVQVNNHQENHISEKPKSSSLKKYSYKEGQWSPDNQDGKRQYDRDFLLEMQKNPLSLRRPDSLPDLEVVLDGPNRPMDGKHKVISDFTPSFLQNTVRRPHQPPFMQQKYQMSRGSQQGKKSSDKDKSLMSEQKVVNINFDHRLQKSTNAWKPAAKKSEPAGDEEISTVRKMRGVLNKLTPENFGKLVDQVKAFNIKNFSTFDKVIGLIFEKAVDEQGFSSTYAELCRVLAQMSVKVEGDASARKDETRFRNLIIAKCQTEFEKDNKKDLKREEKEKEIAAETGKEKRIEMKALLDVEESRLRKRSVGNIRFIGELYKLKMLTSSIMMRIILALLDNKDEESLECLCKLLTTIGKMLESSAQNSQKAQGDLNEIFNSIRNLVESRLTSSRVRFLLMDVVDLRKNGWKPRREDTKPKTKAEVHEEIRKEEEHQQYLLSTTPRRDDRERKRSRDNRGGGGGGGMMTAANDGWSTVVASNTRRGAFDSSRLKNNNFFNQGSDNTVEFRAQYSNWSRGSSGGGMKEQQQQQQQQDELSRPGNRFTVLENQAFPTDVRRGNPMPNTFNHSFRPPRLTPGGGSNMPHRQGTSSFGSKSMPPPSEKENIHSSAKMMAASGDRSKSNSRSSSRQNSRENSLVREPPAIVHREISQTYSVMSEEDAAKFSKSIVEEYVHNDDMKEALICVQEKFVGMNIVKFVLCSLEWVLDRDTDKRRKMGVLYHQLLKNEFLTLPQFIEGSHDILELIPDFVIDIPQVCTYVGGILCRLLVDSLVSLDDILKIIEPSKDKMHTIFAKVIKEASFILGETPVRDMWKLSSVNLQTLLSEGSSVDDYLKQHDILFIVTESILYNNRPISDDEASIDSKVVRKELTKLFRSKVEEEEIFKWIEKNVGRFTNSKKFVRALTAALIESLLNENAETGYVVPDEFEANLGERLKFVQKYIDNNQHLELSCVYGLQALSVEIQHPAGLLEKTFNVLYDKDVVSEETFLKWENSDEPEEQVGKGVCVTSVRKFLVWMKVQDQEAESGIEGN